MPSTLPVQTMLTRLAPETLSQVAQGQRQIERIAGFCGDAEHTQRLYRRLRQAAGLQAKDLVVLKPEDASPFRFDRAARAWAKGRAPERGLRREHRSIGAVVGALAVGVLSWGMTLMDVRQTATAAMVAFLIGALWGAVIGWVVVMLVERLPKVYRFDRQVQRHLKAGTHGVVVVHVPEDRQAEVLAAVRGNSRAWCAEAPRAKRGFFLS